MERICGIYKITNKVNGKVYIGQSVHIKQRWKNHKKDAFWEKGSEYNYPLYRAMRKYGIENFSFEVLEQCQQSELNEKEIQYIAAYQSWGKNGYNQCEGGNSQAHNQKLTETDVQKIILRLKSSFEPLSIIAQDFNVGLTTMYNINIGEAYYQENETYPIRPKLSTILPSTLLRKNPTCIICGAKVNRYGNRCRACASAALRNEHKESFRENPILLAKLVKEKGFEAVGRDFNVTGKAISKWCNSFGIPTHRKELENWYNQQMGIVETPRPKKSIKEIVRPIKQIDLQTGKALNIFLTQKQALDFLGIERHTSHITDVCKGKRKSAYGYFWQYADENNT